MTDEARRKDASVIDDEQIARTQMIDQPREQRVLDRAGLTREHQQSRLTALGWRTLRDQTVREIEIEIAGA